MARMKRSRASSRTSKKKSRGSFSLSQTQQKAVSKIAKRVTLRSSETKKHVTQINQNVSTEGFQSYDLSTIAQGDDIYNRNGRQILATSIRKYMMVRNNSMYEPVLVRTLILQGKDGVFENLNSQTEIFNASDHPDDGNASWQAHASGNGKLLAMMKPIDTTRWIVKEDKRYVLGATPNPNVGSGESHANHDGRGCMRITRSSVNMKGKTIHYCAAGSTIAENINGTDITRSSCENRVWFVVMCCQVDGYQITGDTITHLGNLILYYKDP